MGLASYGDDFEVTVPSLPDNRFDGPPMIERDAVSPRHIHERVRESFIQDFRRLHGDHLPFNRRADVALAAQQAVADRVLMYVSELLDEIDVLSLSGGLALNCAVNSQVAALCRARGVDFTVPPPASDTGVALGSALFGSAEIDSGDSVLTIADPFLGRMFEPQAIARELHDQAAPVEAIDTNELVVELLERSAISGWFEGRAEVGPRALGKRSIIARPDSTAVRDRINVLKGRERWRPLAPSLTPNEFNRAFPGATPSPHMLIAASAAPEAAEALQGVVHVDGTSRPQVVEAPGIYRDLLMSAGTASGAEALTCTSFNRAGEPMVYTPVEALRSAQEMGLDLLAGDGWCVRLHSRRPRNFGADVSRRGGRAAKDATRQTPLESAEHPT